MGIWGKLQDSNEHKTSRRDHLEGSSFHTREFLLVQICFYSSGKKKSNNKKTSPEECEDENMIPESSEKMAML